MAPELFQDSSPPSFASDIWALGCTLYEMATGQPPFISASLSELLSLILESEPEEIVGMPLKTLLRALTAQQHCLDCLRGCPKTQSSEGFGLLL